MKSIKAQYSMEFMLVFAFSLVIIIPLINVMHSQYQQNRDDLDASQAGQVIDELEIAINNAYYAGYPSRTTLELYIPRNIDRIETLHPEGSKSASDLVFVVRRGNSEGSIVRTFPFEVDVSSLTNPQRDGKRQLIIEAEKEGHVSVTEK